MPDKSNNPFKFWQELKRRGVPRILAMYAATAFIIMEAVDIMLPRLGLPDWTVTFVIILLIVGLPVAFVLSWVFDITPQGVVKTGPLEKVEQSGEPEKTRRRKLRLSDVVIVVLLAIVVVLAYPKFFGDADSRYSKYARGRISIAVMPYKNMTGDTVYNLWQGGLQNLLITSLSNSQELSVRQYETMYNILGNQAGVNYASLTSTMAGDAARKAEANTIIIGNMYKSGEQFRVTTNIMNAKTEEIYKSYELQGDVEDDFFVLADSLSRLIRDFLEIKSLKESTFYDLRSVFTKSPEAYKLYLQGQNYHVRLEYPSAIEYYNRALQADSGFVSAMMGLAWCYGDIQQAGMSKEWAYKAYDQIDRLPPDMQLLVNTVRSAVDKDPLAQVYYLNQYLELNPQSMIRFYGLGWVHFNMEQWQASIEAFERSLELARQQELKAWVWTYTLLGCAYHHIGEHKKEQKIFEEGIEIWSQQKPTFHFWQAVCAVSRGDSTNAKLYLDEIRKMTEQKGWPEANLWMWYAGIYDWAESYEMAEYYHRKALSLMPDNPVLKNDFALFLITNDINIAEGNELINRLLENEPTNGDYFYTYGLVLYKRGKLKEAQEVLNKAWDLRPYYNHDHFLHIKEVEKALARENSEQ